MRVRSATSDLNQIEGEIVQAELVHLIDFQEKCVLRVLLLNSTKECLAFTERISRESNPHRSYPERLSRTPYQTNMYLISMKEFEFLCIIREH